MTFYSRPDAEGAHLARHGGETPPLRRQGQLRLDFANGGNGRTFLNRQYASYPFHVCRAQYLDPEMPGLATLYLQSCSGGLYRDDAHRLEFRIAPQAEAHVTTQASTIVHGMATGGAHQDIRIEAEADSYLEYLPDPLILFPASRFSSKTTVSMAEDATVLLNDAYLLHDPAGGERLFSAYTSEIVIEDASGRRLAIDRLSIDTAGIDVRRPGIIGGYAAQGTLVAATRGDHVAATLAELRKLEPCSAEAAIGASLLPRSAGLIVRVLATDGVALRRVLHRCWSICRQAVKDSAAVPRRK
jgi:urease accessory protein